MSPRFSKNDLAKPCTPHRLDRTARRALAVALQQRLQRTARQDQRAIVGVLAYWLSPDSPGMKRD